MHVLQIVGWIVCGVYATIPAFWLLIHPFAEFWRKRFRAPLKVLGLIWIGLWALSWLATSPWRSSTFPIPPLWGLLAVPFWAISLSIYFGGLRHFSLSQVIGRTELESDRFQQVLVTTGLHARMRHPLYFGHLCTMLGWFSLARTEAVFAQLLFAIVTGAALIRAEDAELEARFGDSFRDYKSRVPAVFPKFKLHP